MEKTAFHNIPFSTVHFSVERIKYIAKVYDGIPAFIITKKPKASDCTINFVLLKIPMGLVLEDDRTIVTKTLEDAHNLLLRELNLVSVPIPKVINKPPYVEFLIFSGDVDKIAKL